MSVSLNLDYGQLKALVDQLPPQEKAQMERELRRELAMSDFEKMQQELKDAPITNAEIDAEVEAVRQERYNQRTTR